MEVMKEAPALIKARDRIGKLLAKAERTDSPEEAAVFYAAAEELMRAYNLLVEEVSDEVVHTTFKFAGPSLYWTSWSFGALEIVDAVGRVELAVDNRSREFTLYGYPADVEQVEMLLKSAWRSAFRHMREETKTTSAYLYNSNNGFRAKWRRNYVEGFGVGVANKIRKTQPQNLVETLEARKREIATVMRLDGRRPASALPRSSRSAIGYETGAQTGAVAKLGAVLV